MFNPHMHHQQQQQQFHQHLRQLQQLFQQQPPPPPPQPSAGRHVPHPHQAHQAHQAPRALPVPPPAAPSSRMVNLCQTTQTTIIAPNPMLQGALLMQQMQGNMRGYRMGGQQFRQFFAAGARSSLLGPVPMGVGIKSPMMGFPPARPVYPPHVRYYNNNNNSSVPGSSSATSSTTDAVARPSERKRDIEQVNPELNEEQPGPSTATEASNDGNIVKPDDVDGCCTISEEQLEEPVKKKQKTRGSELITEQPVVSVAEADCEILSSDSETQPEEIGSIVCSEVHELENESTVVEFLKVQGSLTPAEDQHVDMPMVEAPQKEGSLPPAESQEEGEDDVDDGTNQFYCYLCSITCHNQHNFRSHMNSISHQQRMMEIQHMSNACLVSLLPRLKDTLQGTSQDGEKKNELKHWCGTCQTHFTSSVVAHHQTKEHKLARKMAISSCTICKKHFKSSQIFIQHLQSIEHRKKVEMSQENECCEDVTQIPDGFLVEEGAELEDDENVHLSNAEDQEDLNKQDEGTKEVALEDMDDSMQYDPDVLYGGRFFVPVAGFICKLCNKFYHFESSDLNLHCKSLEHFENLKRHKTDKRYEASKKYVGDEESITDCSDPSAELSSKQLCVSVCEVRMEDCEPDEALQDVTISTPGTSAADEALQDVTISTPGTSAADEALQDVTISTPGTCAADEEHTCVEEAATSLTDGDQDSETVPAVTKDSAPSVSDEGNVEDQKVVNKKKTSKATPRRRTARATNRR